MSIYTELFFFKKMNETLTKKFEAEIWFSRYLKKVCFQNKNWGFLKLLFAKLIKFQFFLIFSLKEDET